MGSIVAPVKLTVTKSLPDRGSFPRGCMNKGVNLIQPIKKWGRFDSECWPLSLWSHFGPECAKSWHFSSGNTLNGAELLLYSTCIYSDQILWFKEKETAENSIVCTCAWCVKVQYPDANKGAHTLHQCFPTSVSFQPPDISCGIVLYDRERFFA